MFYLQIDPDPVQVGKHLVVTIHAKPDRGKWDGNRSKAMEWLTKLEFPVVAGGEAIVKVRVLGVVLVKEEISLCDDLGLACPLNKGQPVVARINYPIPHDSPHNIDVDVEIDVNDNNGKEISCFTIHSRVELPFHEISID